MRSFRLLASFAPLLAVAAPIPAAAAGLDCDLESRHIGVGAPGSWTGLDPGNRILLHFRAIDVAAGTALVEGGAGEERVRVAAGPRSLTLTAAAAEGGIATTTILTGTADGSLGDGQLPAAHSRHVTRDGPELVVSQYVGFCQATP